MKQLLILSGKGGTGKTTTAAAFIAFSKARAIADCDVDAPNLHIVTKNESKPIYKDFIGSKKALIDPTLCINCKACINHCEFHAIHQEDGHCRVNEYACEGCGVCQYVCPTHAATLVDDVAGKQAIYLADTIFSTAKLKMGRGNSGKLVTEVKKELQKQATDQELAIIDGSPGIGCPVIASLSGVDFALVVAEPSESGISDLKRLVLTAKNLRTTLAVCVNKWDNSPKHSDEIENYCKEEDIPFVGKIPYDAHASIAINEGKSIADIDCSARDALYRIYQKTMEMIL